MKKKFLSSWVGPMRMRGLKLYKSLGWEGKSKERTEHTHTCNFFNKNIYVQLHRWHQVSKHYPASQYCLTKQKFHFLKFISSSLSTTTNIMALLSILCFAHDCTQALASTHITENTYARVKTPISLMLRPTLLWRMEAWLEVSLVLLSL